MKKRVSRKAVRKKEKPMRREYDFSRGVRGVTAARFARGSNVVVIDPAVRDVFPDEESVNEALRALAPVIRHGRKTA